MSRNNYSENRSRKKLILTQAVNLKQIIRELVLYKLHKRCRLQIIFKNAMDLQYWRKLLDV